MKSPPLSRRKADHTLYLEGVLDFDNAAGVHEGSSGWFEDVEGLDLGGIERIDSAGLAVIIDWKRQHPWLKFGRVPPQLKSLARLSDVDELLGL